MQIWIMPTNEELIVARQCQELLNYELNIARRGGNLERLSRNPMFVAKVTGSVVATQKVDTMIGRKLLVVEPYRIDPQAQAAYDRAERLSPSIRSARARGNSY